MTDGMRTTAYRYLIAISAAAFAAVLRYLLDPYLGDGQPFVTFIIAVAIVATTQGFGPAAIVWLCALFAFRILFHQPAHSFAWPSPQATRTIISFSISSVVVAGMCEALRLARRRAEAGQEELRQEMAHRIRIESKLRDRETHWRTLIENSSDVITLIRADKTLEYVSPSVMKVSGFAPNEIIDGEGVAETHPEDRATADESISKALARPGEPIAFKIRIRHKDGSWRVTENVVTNHLSEPAISALVVNTRDVTERSAMEQRAAESDARFRVFMDHSPAVGYLKDESGRYIWGNHAWASQFGKPVDELIGLDDFALWPEQTAKLFRESDQYALNSGQTIEVEEENDNRHYYSVKFPLNHDKKRYIGGKTFDVTDRVHDREALERSEKLLLALADSMPQIVWAARPDGSTDYFNKRWFEFTGLTPEQSFAPEGWTAVVHPDDVARCRDLWSTSVRTGEPFGVECRFHDRSTETYRWFLSRALPVRDVDGKIVRWYGTCTDIDDQKRAENAAEAANQAKDRFLAVLSHELRTPLTPILLSVSSLLEAPEIAGDVRPALEMIRRNVALESRLIDDLLDLTRIIRGSIILQTEPCDAHFLINRALEICAADLEPAGIQTKLQLNATKHAVLADPARLQQVFWNLFKNAIKFSPKESELSVSSWDDCTTGRLVIEVADRGIGIEPEFIPRMFDAFEQGESAPWTRKFGGLGLGLAISRSIIEAHKGTLSARSDGLGHGATFRVELPIESGAFEVATKTQSEPPKATLESLRILLIEDDPTTLSTLSRLLKYDRHTVTTAASVSDALTAAEVARDDFDLIISDIGLPDGNGVDLLRTLQSRKPCPAIALTGFGMDEDIRKGQAAGFRAHLIKPVDFKTLEETIRKVVATAIA